MISPSAITQLINSVLRRSVRFALLLLLGFSLFPSLAIAGGQTVARAKVAEASATDTSQSTGTVPDGGDMEYIIAPGDLLDVYVVDVPEFSREYRVGPDGNITLPMLHQPIEAAGLAPDQLSSVIEAKLHSAGLVTHASVMVSVKASRVHSVAITGAVTNPQIYPIFGETNLLNVLTQAGGLATDASNTAVITRGGTAMRVLVFQNSTGGKPGDAPPTTIRVNLKKLFDSADSKSNIPIYPGDTVTVLRAGIVYVVGAVNRAGGYTLAGSWQNMTVLKAIALAGNVTSTAKQKNAVIIRKEPSAPGGHVQIRINLKKILAGKAPDQKLAANDILFVPDSTGKKAFRRGVEAVLGVGTGLLIYHAPL